MSFFESNFYKTHKYKKVSGTEINRNAKNHIFYKILNRELMAFPVYGIKLGVNYCIDQFIPESDNKENNIKFTDENTIFIESIYGDVVADIVIPNDAICYLDYKYIKSNKIIVKSITNINEHKLGKSYVFFKNAILYNNKILDSADKNNTTLIQHINKKIEDICLMAVKYDGCLLKYINNQTHDICLEAVKQNKNAIDYVKSLTKSICIAAGFPQKENNDEPQTPQQNFQLNILKNAVLKIGNEVVDCYAHE